MKKPTRVIKKKLTIDELYSILVLKMGLQPSYVLDEMEFYEIKALLNYQYYKEQDAWEQARFLGYITAKSHGAKNLKITDLIKFQWERENAKKPQFMSDADMQRLRNKAQWLIENNMLDTV